MGCCGCCARDIARTVNNITNVRSARISLFCRRKPIAIIPDVRGLTASAQASEPWPDGGYWGELQGFRREDCEGTVSLRGSHGSVGLRFFHMRSHKKQSAGHWPPAYNLLTKKE